MSSNDKAKQKLMDSMRMTKASPGKKINEAGKTQDSAPKEVEPVKPKKTAMTKKTSKHSKEISVDPYQAVGRVWPD